MDAMLLQVGRLLGLVGVVLIAVSVAWRATGQYWLAGFQLGTLMLGGIAAIAVACLALLLVLELRSRR